LDFLADQDEMERQSRALVRLADDQELADLFHLARPRDGHPVELPWLDVDHAILVAVSHAGDDTAIALDYRTDPTNPRVVGSDAWTLPSQYHWRTITPALSSFVEALGLDAAANT
jgi:hypothetical protein